MTIQLLTQHVLSNGPDSSVLAHPARVLAVVPAEDTVWLIEMPRPHPKHPNRFSSYYRGPRKHSLMMLSALLREGRLVAGTQKIRRELDGTDEELRQDQPNERQRERIDAMIKHRNARYAAVLCVLSECADCAECAAAPRPFLQVITDPALPQRMQQCALKAGMALPTLYAVVHQYWSHGSWKNGLCNGYWRCGNAGQPKAQKNKLGRQSRPFKAGEAGPGFVMTDEDKRKAGFGYRLINVRRTAFDAYPLASGVFWADQLVGEDGVPQSILWPVDRRPTQAQFMYWGRKQNEDKSVQEIVLGPQRWNQRSASRGGSAQDHIVTVGQWSFFDGTSTDLYLTSESHRLRKLPAATRLVLQEGRSTLIYGLYCGWEPPSPATAMQCILHGATSKVEFCRRFGIEIEEADWPFLLAHTHQADNGELKAREITESEEQFGYSVEYVQARRGDKKPTIESTHRVMHKALDHKLEGTTHGRRRERGDEDPAALALWNYWEYMRELILAILDYNNEEVLELAPPAMLQQAPHLRPTRLNIFLWLRGQGMTSELPADPEAMRAFMLPTCDAVLMKNGLHLKVVIQGYAQIIPKLRYTSLDPRFLALLSAVKLSGQTEQTKVHLSRQDLSVVWLRTRKGMLRLELASSDTLLRQRMTLDDWCHWLADLSMRRSAATGERQQHHLQRLLRRAAVTANAKREEKQEIADLPKPPSKRQKRANLTANRDREKMLIDQRLRNDGAPGTTPVASPPDSSADDNPPAQDAAPPSAAERAMAKFRKAP